MAERFTPRVVTAVLARAGTAVADSPLRPTRLCPAARHRGAGAPDGARAPEVRA